jgi:hypothetical protein
MAYSGALRASTAVAVRTAPRADPVGFLLLLVAGLCGLLPLVLPWVPLPDALLEARGLRLSSASGWQLVQVLAGIDGGGLDVLGLRILLIGVAAGGAALVLLSMLMLLPMSHRPVGTAALVVSIGSLAAASWLFVRATTLFGENAGAVLSGAEVGFWLFVATGAVALFGAVKALATG